MNQCISAEEKIREMDSKWGKSAGLFNHELDKLIVHINHRKEETDDLYAKMNSIVTKFSTMEDHIWVLEEESVEKAAKIELLTSKVEHLQGKMCHCHKLNSRLLSGSGTTEDPHKLDYAFDSEYVALPVITTLVPVDAEGECDPTCAS